jgi:hypothetical protein
MEQKDYAVCAFHLREDAGMHRIGMMYKYTSLWLNGARGDGKLYTLYPPVVGDTILLIDDTQDISGTFRIIARDVSHSQYGSANWPHGKQHSDVGPCFTYLVVRAEGLFQNEVFAVSEDGNGNVEEDK